MKKYRTLEVGKVYKVECDNPMWQGYWIVEIKSYGNTRTFYYHKRPKSRVGTTLYFRNLEHKLRSEMGYQWFTVQELPDYKNKIQVDKEVENWLE